MGTAAVFIDGAYLDNVMLHDFAGQRLKYDLFATKITVKHDLLRVYYYHCLPYQSRKPTPEESGRLGQMQGFFRALQRTDKFEVKLGRVEFRGVDSNGKSIFVQKRVDLLLGLDMALLAGKRLMSDAFLVAGDSDMIPAVEAAKAAGVVVHLVHGSSPHDDLLDAVDVRVPMTRMLVADILR